MRLIFLSIANRRSSRLAHVLYLTYVQMRDEIRVSSDWYPDRTRVRCIIRKPLLVDYK